MEKETVKMIEEKIRFVKAIETMLAADKKNNGVDSLVYKVDLQDKEGTTYDEYIKVIFDTGNYIRILATGNSNSANLRAIIKEVY